jgi:hypothetical protein
MPRQGKYLQYHIGTLLPIKGNVTIAVVVGADTYRVNIQKSNITAQHWYTKDDIVHGTLYMRSGTIINIKQKKVGRKYLPHGKESVVIKKNGDILFSCSTNMGTLCADDSAALISSTEDTKTVIYANQYGYSDHNCLPAVTKEDDVSHTTRRYISGVSHGVWSVKDKRTATWRHMIYHEGKLIHEF